MTTTIQAIAEEIEQIINEETIVGNEEMPSEKLPSTGFRRLLNKETSQLEARLKHFQENLALIEAGKIVPALDGMLDRYSVKDVTASLKKAISKLEKAIALKKLP